MYIFTIRSPCVAELGSVTDARSWILSLPELPPQKGVRVMEMVALNGRMGRVHLDDEGYEYNRLCH